MSSQDHLLSRLERLGFSEKEVKVYLTLIRLGAQTASVVGRVTGLNRTSVYDLMEALMGRGLVSSSKGKGRTVFQALSPQQLHSYLEREKEEAVRRIERQQRLVDDLVPELMSLEHESTERPRVTFFEGDKGMRQAYEDTLSSKGPILAYANVASMHQALPDFFPEYYQRRAVENKIPIRAIMPDNAASRARAKRDCEELRESLLVPEKDYGFSPELNVYDNKVLIASWQEKIAILIESQEVADLHRKMHQLAWGKGKH